MRDSKSNADRMKEDSPEKVLSELEARNFRGMTIDKLQSAVRVLANGGWCRYWVSWNIFTWPDGRLGSLMAIQCRDDKGDPQPISDASRHGFTEHEDFFYTVPRINEDNTPYINRNP